MAQEGKPPEHGPASDAPSGGRTPDEARAASPASSADDEKDAQVEAAKARVEAAKAAALGAPKAPVKKKEEGPKPVDASDHPLVRKLKAKLGPAVREAAEFLGQLSICIDPAHILTACESLRDDDATPFEYLSDLTCVHYPDQKEAPFQIVYNLYSISKNERVR